MGLQPGGEAGAGAVGQEVDGAMPFEVDQDRPVGQSSMDRPVVDAEHGRRGPLDLRRLSEQPQQRVGADPVPEFGRKPRSGLAPERRGEVEERRPLALGAPRRRPGGPGEPFAEDPARAGRVVAEELPDLHPELDGGHCPRQVGERAGGAAMNPLRGFAADGAAHDGGLGEDAERQAVVADQERLGVERRRDQPGDRGDHGAPPPAEQPGSGIVTQARRHREPLHLKCGRAGVLDTGG
jgi:hypothetical protein